MSIMFGQFGPMPGVVMPGGFVMSGVAAPAFMGGGGIVVVQGQNTAKTPFQHFPQDAAEFDSLFPQCKGKLDNLNKLTLSAQDSVKLQEFWKKLNGDLQTTYNRNDSILKKGQLLHLKKLNEEVDEMYARVSKAAAAVVASPSYPMNPSHVAFYKALNRACK